MVGSNGTMIAIRLVGSKLRKREEHSNSVHPTDVVLQTQPNNNSPSIPAHQQPPVATQQLPADPFMHRGQLHWQFPPPPPKPLYNNDQGVEKVQRLFPLSLFILKLILERKNNQDFLLFQDNLVQNIPTERPGFVRGFRKNLGGRWRRLVKKKPTTEVYTIPAELKPQLKQIYVY
ncbi:alcohol dehydrogenase transcription factor myb/sant-like [Holotrichia oblita]|uniref:Alcohol dehydrogenase transcription factor myb/sant-like n=1 Tax=Holotrichia oblita TaxID=644536 RepID=A0ACB9SWW4_HOLOL|nr:alcohol dehydrogenase transcription factor myb/sant-like [Holotrichia oblita]